MATHKTRREKLSGHKQVLVFLEGLDHSFSKEIQEVRKIILDADQNLTEQIKWNAPSFCHNREDRITFNLHAKDHFKLIFHCGAKPKDTKTNRQLFDDETGLLSWITADRATVQFTDMKDVAAKKEPLIEVIGKWIQATS